MSDNLQAIACTIIFHGLSYFWHPPPNTQLQSPEGGIMHFLCTDLINNSAHPPIFFLVNLTGIVLKKK